jgi:hypothetical protein
MYSKEHASQVRQAFWTAFGQYIAPHPSAEGYKVNWVNYKTGVKDVYFRMKADQKMASIAIELTHKDIGVQELYYEQFLELKGYLHGVIGEEWDWELHGKNEYGQTLSRISKSMAGVSIFNQDDWPELISFFKPRIIALDEFWSDAKYKFFELL